MNIEFDVKMTQKMLYDFWMTHTYRGFSGVFSIVFSLMVVVIAIISWNTITVPMRVLYIVFAVYFLLFQPVSLYIRAAKAVKLNPMFQKPLHYEMNETGIITSQGENQTIIPWEQITKVLETRYSYLLYTGKRTSFILPLECMGAQATVAEGLIRKYVKPECVKIK